MYSAFVPVAYSSGANAVWAKGVCNGMLSGYPDVLTVRDIQKIFRVGRSTAYDMVRSGSIPSIRVGSTYRISKDTVRDILCYNSTYADGGHDIANIEVGGEP